MGGWWESRVRLWIAEDLPIRHKVLGTEAVSKCYLGAEIPQVTLLAHDLQLVTNADILIGCQPWEMFNKGRELFSGNVS